MTAYAGPDGMLRSLESLTLDIDDGVLTIAVNRPARRNRIDADTAHRLARVLDAVRADEAVRVVVLRGEGDGFCEGLDADDDADPQRPPRGFLEPWRSRGLRLLPQPVVASVHGYCEGEAVALLEACDIVLAADDTAFRPDTATDPYDGPEAERRGVATRSMPADRLAAETAVLARDLAAKDPTALRFTKETLLHVHDMSWDAALSFTAAKFAELKAIQAGRESTRASAIAGFLAGANKPGAGA